MDDKKSWFAAGSEKVSVWLGERGLTALLVMLVVDLFLLPILGPGLGRLALDIVFSILLVTGVCALAERRLPRILAIGFAVQAMAFRWLEWSGAGPVTAVGANAATLVAMAVLSLLVLLRTLSPGPITGFRIQGAVATYLLIGVTFAQAYELTERRKPGSFHFAEIVPAPEQSYAFSYFSLVTLTTVGYGDVTPASPEAQSLATLEGSIGQLYPAIILGWMVASLRTRRPD
jgi:hypothetical protein